MGNHGRRRRKGGGDQYTHSGTEASLYISTLHYEGQKKRSVSIVPLTYFQIEKRSDHANVMGNFCWRLAEEAAHNSSSKKKFEINLEIFGFKWSKIG